MGREGRGCCGCEVEGVVDVRLRFKMGTHVHGVEAEVEGGVGVGLRAGMCGNLTGVCVCH